MQTEHRLNSRGVCLFCGLEIALLPEEEQSEYCSAAPKRIEQTYKQDAEVIRTKSLTELSIIKPGSKGLVKENSTARYHMVYWIKERMTMVMHIDQIAPVRNQ